MTAPLRPARLSLRDLLRVGAIGLRTRRLRAFLSALGIAIGIAAMVSVVGISASSQAEVERRLAALGTNLLTVAPGSTFFGEAATLPDEAPDMIGRIKPVTAVASTGRTSSRVYRSDRIPPAETGGLGVRAASLELPGTVGATVRSGTWLNEATARYPAVVLGSTAARRLGITSPDGGPQVWLGGQWFTVVGILETVPLAPEIDTSALVGWAVAVERLGFDGHPSTVYTRTRDDAVEAVRGVLAATANPKSPNEVKVSRPSDALAAKEATDDAFTGLLLGLGAVALLVGGVGVANTMVISVLERRAEIGLRRSLGATRGHVRTQFLTESLLLAALGGCGGVLLGCLVTGGYAIMQDWPPTVPAWALTGGVLATVVIGGIAGLYPAVRAARLSPTEALATP
ncbi:putative ABC transport system permease protein [Allocatelliglobosispora scoriae]|uniref:Putative ABC transport system permease protein n=1 Tax=Allocatelliglobosispora scoriae TaxID=643052 RepID=A0A841BU52_9ACTN|nr:ABC transporter permease [Allocatelliglobosispora scoriae]MBB5870689.1 putative ABC transport system permease protein [Allocatelliglobosispora scoriae]